MLARELKYIYSIFRDTENLLIRLKKMKLKKNTKSSNDQSSLKDTEIKTEAISSSRIRRKAAVSGHSQLNGFAPQSKTETNGIKEISHKIMTNNQASSKDAEIKTEAVSSRRIRKKAIDSDHNQLNGVASQSKTETNGIIEMSHKVITNDQASPKDAKIKTDAISSRRIKRKAANSDHSQLNNFVLQSKTAKGSKEMNHKIMGTSVPLQSNVVMKELQIKLTRCDDEAVKMCNGMEQVQSLLNEKMKSKTKTRKGILKKVPKKNIKKLNNIPASIPEVAEDEQIDENVEVCDTSEVNYSRLISEAKPKSAARGKRPKKNSTVSKKGTNNIPDKTENEQLDDKFHNGNLTEELQVQLQRCDDRVQENVETKTSDDSDLSVAVAKNIKSVPNQKGTKRKRGGGSPNEDKNDGDAKPSKSAKKDKDSDKSKGSRDKIPDVTALDFSNDSQSPSGNKWNFKISSWNVNGIRAWLEKNGLSYLHHEEPDIICVQETKCSDDKLPEAVKEVEGYHAYWLSGDKDGYSGVGLLSKEEPIKIDYGIGISEHDNEGRVITAEYEKFYLVSTYVPNAGRKLVRLEYRMKWDKDFRAYLKALDAKKPVILCGDLNVAHEEIDLANPKTNKKNAGFTKEEREGFSALLSEGFTDTFRQLYPDVTGAYTFWTYMMNARAKNVGWRLDYFVISERFCDNLCDSVIRKDVFGSDHCPITLFLSI